MGGYDALVSAAEDAERDGRWRRAFGFWNEAISQYGYSVSPQLLELWEYHRDMCDRKMLEFHDE